jgi:hypothetical protein
MSPRLHTDHLPHQCPASSSALEGSTLLYCSAHAMLLSGAVMQPRLLVCRGVLFQSVCSALLIFICSCKDTPAAVFAVSGVAAFVRGTSGIPEAARPGIAAPLVLLLMLLPLACQLCGCTYWVGLAALTVN